MSKFELEVCLSMSKGTNVDLYYPNDTDYADDETNELKDIAEGLDQIGKHYAAVLSILFGGLSDSPGIKRLQLAFAAACGGFSIEEWDQLDEAVQNATRSKYCSFLRPRKTSKDRKPPTLVIYMGGNRKGLIPASPSYQLQCLDTIPNPKLELWHNDWNEATSSVALPCEWGWHVREGAAYGGASLIFLSGAFVVWPQL